MTLTGLFVTAGAIALSPLPDVDNGGPLSWKQAFRDQISACWVVNTGGPLLRITLEAELRPDGTVVSGSVRLIDAPEAPADDVAYAFQAARRALLRCQGSGYNLPQRHYAQWQTVELVFDATGFRP